jgi:HSP20 family protein
MAKREDMTDTHERVPAPARRWAPFREDSFALPGLARFRSDTPGLWGWLEELATYIPPLAARGSFPPVDFAENDQAYVLTAELPGTRPEDVIVEAHEGVLTIGGEKRNERQRETDQMRCTERSFGSFSRSFTLPSNADPEKVFVDFREGVLTLTILKREGAKPWW